MKYIKPWVQEAQRILSSISTKQSDTPNHIFKLLKIKDKRKILKAVRDTEETILLRKKDKYKYPSHLK